MKFTWLVLIISLAGCSTTGSFYPTNDTPRAVTESYEMSRMVPNVLFQKNF